MTANGHVGSNGASASASSPFDDTLLLEGETLPDEDLEEEEERARAFLAGGAFVTVAIDRHDDLAAIFGKIDSASSPRVALVAAPLAA